MQFCTMPLLPPRACHGRWIYLPQLEILEDRLPPGELLFTRIWGGLLGELALSLRDNAPPTQDTQMTEAGLPPAPRDESALLPSSPSPAEPTELESRLPQRRTEQLALPTGQPGAPEIASVFRALPALFEGRVLENAFAPGARPVPTHHQARTGESTSPTHAAGLPDFGTCQHCAVCGCVTGCG